jgi:hypothetical protein
MSTMKHTYTKLRETKKHSLLNELNVEVRNILKSDYMNGNIKGITIKDSGYTHEQVLVKMKDGEDIVLKTVNGRWEKSFMKDLQMENSAV